MHFPPPKRRNPRKGRRPRLRGSSWCGCRKSRSIRRAWPATTLFYRRRSRLRCVSNPACWALYAVAAKEAPGQVTILEIYADRAAYESHITTPHFRKYKEGTPRYGALPRTRRCRPAYARFGVAADGRYPVNSGAACLSAGPTPSISGFSRRLRYDGNCPCLFAAPSFCFLLLYACPVPVVLACRRNSAQTIPVAIATLSDSEPRRPAG